MITEFHTTDLVSRCFKRVQLRHQGKIIPEVASAMFRGLLIHHHLECWHIDKAASYGHVLDSIKAEGRQLTPAALRDVAETNEEAIALTALYAKRYKDFFAKSELLGVEVPLRWSGIDVDGKPVDFATHLDLLFRDPSGVLCDWDWKTGDTDWDGEHANRSLQFGMQFMAIQYGQVMLQGEWIDLRESPHIRVVNIDNLKPYSRRTMGKDINGEDFEYVKGDEKPEWSIGREQLITNESGILEQFATKVRMSRLNLWPMNPTDTGCRACECRKHCPTWTSDEKETADEGI